MKRVIIIIAIGMMTAVVTGLTGCSVKSNEAVLGEWDATVLNKLEKEVAFKLEVKEEDGDLVGSLVNGDQRVPSSSGEFDGTNLKLRFDYYDAVLDANLADGELQGEFRRQLRKRVLSRKLRAWRSDGRVKSDVEPGGDVSGDWVLRVGEGEKERIWRATFRQQGNELLGTIIPLSGDWGLMTGRIENGEVELAKFDGINAYLFTARLTEDGRMEGMINSERKTIAVRAGSDPDGIQAKLPDPTRYMRMKNPAEPLRFSFIDVDRKPVSLADQRFRNKVVIITIGGSWCPNCHEEAAVLNDFYDRYRDQGLEIISLNYEYTGDVERDLEQIRIFIKRHNIQFPMLLAGTTDEGEIQRTLPQLVNFGGYPTAIFVGRDGLVKRIHIGFEGRAAGERHDKLKAVLEKMVKDLLAGREPSDI